MIAQLTPAGGATLFLIANLLCILALLFVERKDPVTTMAWIMVMVFLPTVGMLFYLFFGRGLHISKHRQLVEKHRIDLEFVDEVLSDNAREYAALSRSPEQHEVVFHRASAAKCLSLIRMNLMTDHSRFTMDNHVHIFTHARDKYEALLEDIGQAEHSIHLLYFIIKNDDISRRIVAALTEKAAQGVVVRCCYDDLGSFTTSNRIFAPLRRAGGHVSRFFPLNPFTMFRANYRNHRKIVVIDGRIGYVGGMNIGDEYMGLHPKKTPWRDTHLRITGQAVHDLQARFFMDWHYASLRGRISHIDHLPGYFPPLEYGPEETGSTGTQIVSSGPDTEGEQIKRALIRLFGMAEKSILIQTPYFIPDQPFLEALQIAAQSGVEVTVMIPGIPDKRSVYAVTTSYIQELLDYGIQVYKYRGFLHAKMVVVDGEIATIGTLNMDVRSFRLHFEVNGFFYDRRFAEECVDIFRQDLLESDRVTEKEHRKRGFFRKAFEDVARLCAPLM